MKWAKAWLRNPYAWAVAIRLIYLFALPHELRGDAGDYHQIAQNISSGHGFSRCWQSPFPLTAQRPPLYPFFLSLVYWLSGPGGVAAGVFNLLFDLISMRLLRNWAEQIGMARSSRAPWIIALNPLLIGFSAYPNVENLGMLLFLAATWLFFANRAALAGVMFGLLSLVRSFFILFPVVFGLVALCRQAGPWSRRSLVTLALLGFAAPGIWIARNYITLDRLAFSQGSTVGYQSYAGVCMLNFDWWNAQDVAAFTGIPAASRIMTAQCATDDQISAWDQEMKTKVIECVRDHPIQAARNVAAKHLNLFINWGQLAPYYAIPQTLHLFTNFLLLIFWFAAARLLLITVNQSGWARALTAWREKRIGIELGAAYALLTLLYVAGVTLPFAVDARYLLAPTTLIMALTFCRDGGLLRARRAP